MRVQTNGGFLKSGYRQMDGLMENPIDIDDLGVPPFLEPPKCGIGGAFQESPYFSIKKMTLDFVDIKLTRLGTWDLTAAGVVFGAVVAAPPKT